MKKLILALTLSLFFYSLPAEVIFVKLKWNPKSCLRDCQNAVQANLRNVSGVQTVTYNPTSGEATIGWNPNTPFSLPAITVPIRSYGLVLNAIKFEVRGTITHQGDDFYLVSSGDNTRFTLLGPTRTSEGNRYVSKWSVANHPLPPDMKSQLLDAESKNQIVTIDAEKLNAYLQNDLNVIVNSVKNGAASN